MTRLRSLRFFRLAALVLGVFAVTLLGARPAAAQGCQTLRYTFQPDCLASPLHPGTCPAAIYKLDPNDPTKETKEIDHLDLGPQIAVWLESADRTVFVDTLMVTNMVAARGIGNRPGLANFVSSPRFPYGRRQMALPIWAYARGVLYPTVVFQDVDTRGVSGACSGEGRIGFHEPCSSPDPFYCRPMMATEIVDAVTCPSPLFNSSKGHFDPNLPKSYYPPRNDLGAAPAGDPTNLSRFTSRDCDLVNDALTLDAKGDGVTGSCTVDASTYADRNDLDAVAAATPVYGQPYSGTWNVPQNLAAGDYALWVEVNKEFDSNSTHNAASHPSVQDAGLASYGLSGNFGQPSVVYRVPIRIDGATPATGFTSQIAGYSSWQGDSGLVITRDATITTTIPGSGEGRLLQISGAAGTGRVLVSLEQNATPPTPLMVSNLHVATEDVMATSAVVRFRNASANGLPVSGYEIRYLPTTDATLTVDQFSQGNSARQVTPGPPDSDTMVLIDTLKPNTHYVVGIRSQGPCMSQSDIALADFTTPNMKFTQLSGCFIATAAYGSAMQPQVTALRSVRDALQPRSGLVAAAVDLYYRSGPAAAAVIQRSDTARTLARRLLAPAAELAGLLQSAGVLGATPSVQP